MVTIRTLFMLPWYSLDSPMPGFGRPAGRCRSHLGYSFGRWRGGHPCVNIIAQQQSHVGLDEEELQLLSTDEHLGPSRGVHEIFECLYSANNI